MRKRSVREEERQAKRRRKKKEQQLGFNVFQVIMFNWQWVLEGRTQG